MNAAAAAGPSTAPSLSALAEPQSRLVDAAATTASEDPENFDYNFTIKDLTGNKMTFDQFKGKVVFLNLWATWCGPCRAEMAAIQKLYASTQQDNIAFVMLSIDKDRDKQKIVEYIKNKEFTFPVYQPSGYLSEQLKVPSIPTTFIISKDGKIMSIEIGTTNFNTAKFKKFIKSLASK